MSRSALWHQEKNIQKRQQEAEEAWEQAVEEGRHNRAKNLVPLWGSDEGFNFNPMLLHNIRKSPYFVKCCRELKDWNALVDEIYYRVDHMEPWAVGTSLDSTAKSPRLLPFSLSCRFLTCTFSFFRYVGKIVQLTTEKTQAEDGTTVGQDPLQ